MDSRDSDRGQLDREPPLIVSTDEYADPLAQFAADRDTADAVEAVGAPTGEVAAQPPVMREPRSWAPLAVVGVALAAFAGGAYLYATYPAGRATTEQARVSLPPEAKEPEPVRADAPQEALPPQIVETAPVTPTPPTPSENRRAAERPRPAPPERTAATSEPSAGVPAADAAAPLAAGDVESPSLSGEWSMNTRVVSSNLQRYEGLRLEYQLRLRQVGNNVTGTGYKLRENDRLVATKTPITLQGDVDGDRVVLTFQERGTRRPSAGKLVLLRESDDVLRGRFSSDAAQSAGVVDARR